MSLKAGCSLHWWAIESGLQLLLDTSSRMKDNSNRNSRSSSSSTITIAVSSSKWRFLVDKLIPYL